MEYKPDVTRKLSSISRSLGEDILLKKTEERLSHHLAIKGPWQKINEIVVAHGARKIHKDTLIVIDPTDIRKRYAKKMPYLARVRRWEYRGNCKWLLGVCGHCL